MESIKEELRKEIYRLAAINRLKYSNASPKHVFAAFMKEFKNKIDKSEIKFYLVEVEKICEEINKEDISKLRNEFKLQESDDKSNEPSSLEDLLEKLKDLPHAEKGKVVTRFEPSPSGPLHLGHVFPLLLNYWYSKKYNGKFILRIADTNPRNILPEAYDMIVEDVEYLTGELFEPIIQSERIPLYYDIIEELIKNNFAYVCTCKQEEFKEYVSKGTPCPHRSQTPEENLEKWKKMLSGEYKEGEAVVRIKTLLNHENPAVREWVAFRIVEHPHPLHEDKYIVYPTMNFSVPVDDHLNGITHIIRGKDHEVNTLRQQYIYEYMGWNTPTFIHIGRVNFEDLKLSTTQTKEKISQGVYDGWDDVRLPFIRSFRRRGFKPEAFSWWVLQIGLSKRDKKTSYKEFMKNFVKIHRVLIDKESDRLFFISKPVAVRIINLKEDFSISLPNHPDLEERGERFLRFLKDKPIVYLEEQDWKRLRVQDNLRLKYAFTIEKISENEAKIVSDENVKKIVHYVPEGAQISCEVVMDNGSVLKGLVENNILEKPIGSLLQFERFGFVKLDNIIKEKLYIYVRTYYIHE